MPREVLAYILHFDDAAVGTVFVVGGTAEHTKVVGGIVNGSGIVEGKESGLDGSGPSGSDPYPVVLVNHDAFGRGYFGKIDIKDRSPCPVLLQHLEDLFHFIVCHPEISLLVERESVDDGVVGIVSSSGGYFDGRVRGVIMLHELEVAEFKESRRA